VRDILPDCLVSVVGVEWFGSEALELTCEDPAGRIATGSPIVTMSRASRSPGRAAPGAWTATARSSGEQDRTAAARVSASRFPSGS